MITQYPKPLRHTERKRMAQLLAILSRPGLSGERRQQLRRFVDEHLPEPLPLLPSLFPLEPLFRHHAIRARVEPERLFDYGPHWQPPSFQIMAEAYYDRADILKELGATFHEKRIEPAVLVKGSALAEAYPSPALRYMCDIDLVVRPQEKPEAERVLEECGLWRVQNLAGIGWKWSEWGKLDFQLPHSEFAREVLEHAVTPPTWMGSIPKGFLVPTVPYHLVIVALHSAQHRGSRLWRDVCDARALLKHQPDGFREAIAIARRHELLPISRRQAVLPHLLAFCEFMRRLAGDKRAPALADQKLTPEETRRTAASLALYEKMAFETAPPVFLNVLRRTRDIPRRLLHPRTFAKDFFRRTMVMPSRPWPQSLSPGADPILGRVPDAGSPALHMLKVRLILGLLFTGAGRYYRRLLQVDRQAAISANLFVPPMD